MAATGTTVRIPLDRARVDRAWGLLIVGTVLLVGVVVAAITALLLRAGAGLVDVMPVLIVLPLGAAYVAITFGLSWRRIRKVAVPLELGAEGVVLHSPYGDVAAPWPAVASVAIERRLLGPWLRVRLAPEGFTTTVTQRYYLSTLQKQGFRYALRVLAVDAEQLRAAFAQQSGGRVTVTTAG
jgi:hypothetical protein